MENWIPLLSGLLGAIIGATASVVTVYIQSKVNANRDRHKQITELAWRDYELHRSEAIELKLKTPMPPVGTYLLYHLKLNELLEQNKLSDDAIINLSQESRELFEKMIQAQKK